MSNRTQHGWQLMTQSLSALSANKKLFLIPTFAALICYSLLAIMVIPFYQYRDPSIHLTTQQWHHFLWLYLILFVVLYFFNAILFFCNIAFTICLLNYFKKAPANIGIGLKIAFHKFWAIFLWALFACTIGLFILIFQKQLEKIKFIKNMLGEQHWTIANYFVTPIMATETINGPSACKKASALMTKVWGPAAKPDFGFGWFILITRLLILTPLWASLYIGDKTSIIIGTTITIILFLISFTLNLCTRTTIGAAIYLYTTEKKIAPHFDEKIIRHAFISKNK